jgi:adenosylcobinamide kinase/adenosylcobinamide-phosphate guanylyltransferase
LAPREEVFAIETTLCAVTLVLGGAASGKSVFAERLIEAGFASLWDHATYLATATAGDGEMSDKIRCHRARRGAQWITVEEPLDLAGAMIQHDDPARPILVDCLTLWLSNVMLAERDIDAQTARLAETLNELSGPVVLVANEVGLSIVPDNALARRFRESAGRLNQAIAAIADRVYFVAAGLPLILKD